LHGLAGLDKPKRYAMLFCPVRKLLRGLAAALVGCVAETALVEETRLTVAYDTKLQSKGLQLRAD